MCLAFCFYLINFEMKYLPGNMYTNVSVAALAEVTAKGVASLQVHVLGVQRALFYACLLGVVGAIGLL